MNPHQHLQLLLRHDRVLALRSVLRQVVQPGMRVLDAGCGTGILTLWAAQAGAANAVGIDIDDLSVARALATENGVADRVRFVDGDLRAPGALPGEAPFDVIFALLYLNDPRRDEAQAALTFGLRDRYLASGGRMVPNRVRYLAQAATWPAQASAARRIRLRADVADIEGRTGLRMSGLHDAVAAQPWLSQFPAREPDGRLDLDGARLLGSPTEVFTVDYEADPTRTPPVLSVELESQGIVDVIVWTQELWSDDQLIFRNESVSWTSESQAASAGETLEFELGEDWRARNLLHRCSSRG